MNTKTYSWLVKIKAVILIAAPRKYFLQFGTPFVFCKPDIAAQNLTPKHQAVHTELNERVKRVNFSLSLYRDLTHTHTHTHSLSLFLSDDTVILFTLPSLRKIMGWKLESKPGSKIIELQLLICIKKLQKLATKKFFVIII